MRFDCTDCPNQHSSISEFLECLVETATPRSEVTAVIDIAKRPIKDKLPVALPKDRFACPICGSTVHLTGVQEWDSGTGEIIQADYDCETEPDIDSEEWEDWHRGHFAMPYVDWLPWEERLLPWINEHYHNLDSGGGDDDGR